MSLKLKCSYKEELSYARTCFDHPCHMMVWLFKVHPVYYQNLNIQGTDACFFFSTFFYRNCDVSFNIDAPRQL